MSKQTQAENVQRPHALTLDNRKTLTMTGVDEVIAFDEKQLVLQTGGGRLTISGDGLHVTALLLEEGRVAVDGQVDAIVYNGRSKNQKSALRGFFG